MCINILYREFPEIKAFGCCHEVFGTKNLLCNIAGMYLALSEEGKRAFMAGDLRAVKLALAKIGRSFNWFWSFRQIKRQDITANVQGLNHFTWINKAGYKGLDLLEIYRAYIKLFRENNEAFLRKHAPPVFHRLYNMHNVKFKLFEEYGAVAAAGDRHLAEFVPDLFLTGKHVLRMGFALTPVTRRKFNDNVRTFMTKLADTPFYSPKIRGTGEEGVMQMTALLGLEDLVTNVNVPNRGQQGNVTPGAAVETDAAFTLDSVVPLDAGDMSPETAALVNLHAQNQMDFVEAYFQRDRAALEAVFCRDPMIARIGEESGKKLFAEMIELNAECLEDFLK